MPTPAPKPPPRVDARPSAGRSQSCVPRRRKATSWRVSCAARASSSRAARATGTRSNTTPRATKPGSIAARSGSEMGRQAVLAPIALAGCTAFVIAPRAGAAEAKLELAVPPRAAEDPETPATRLREPEADRSTELESRYEGVAAAGARATFGRTLTENV